MDETTKSIIARITTSYPTPQRIPSGQESSTYYNCSLLNPNELARLAAEAVGDLSEDAFDVAVGLAYRGILFAAAIAGGRDVAILQTDGKFTGPELRGKRVLIVDDVVYTGSRLYSAEQSLTAAGAKVVGYACIIDRSDGAVGSKDRPAFSAFQTNML